MSIRLRKISETPDPRYPAGDPKTYKEGENNGLVSLPVQYEVEGIPMFPIEVGGIICLFRQKRNGVQVNGVFRSSIVSAIEDTPSGERLIRTQNSVYLYKKL